MVGMKSRTRAGGTVAIYGEQRVDRGALWWMFGWWGAVRRADTAVVCGPLPIVGKQWMGEGHTGTFGVSPINSSSCSLLWVGVGGC